MTRIRHKVTRQGQDSLIAGLCGRSKGQDDETGGRVLEYTISQGPETLYNNLKPFNIIENIPKCSDWSHFVYEHSDRLQSCTAFV